MQSKRKELIDTLWNVNVSTDDAELSIDMELIDTLWNVNKYKIGQEERVSITN